MLLNNPQSTTFPSYRFLTNRGYAKRQDESISHALLIYTWLGKHMIYQCPVSRQHPVHIIAINTSQILLKWCKWFNMVSAGNSPISMVSPSTEVLTGSETWLGSLAPILLTARIRNLYVVSGLRSLIWYVVCCKQNVKMCKSQSSLSRIIFPLHH